MKHYQYRITITRNSVYHTEQFEAEWVFDRFDEAIEQFKVLLKEEAGFYSSSIAGESTLQLTYQHDPAAPVQLHYHVNLQGISFLTDIAAKYSEKAGYKQIVKHAKKATKKSAAN